MSEPTESTEDGSSFPGCQISLVNPVGAMLVLRSDGVVGLVEQLNQIWDSQHGDRSDLTNLYLFSFNPAIIADMRAGRSAEEAMGYEPDDMAAAAFEAIKAGATRQPTAAAAAANGGSRSGGGPGKPTIFTVAEVGEDSLPDWFLDKLTRKDLCPECEDPEGKFYDNRADPGNGPVFRCANRDCKTSKGYAWGVFDPATSSRSRGSARTR